MVIKSVIILINIVVKFMIYKLFRFFIFISFNIFLDIFWNQILLFLYFFVMKVLESIPQKKSFVGVECRFWCGGRRSPPLGKGLGHSFGLEGGGELDACHVPLCLSQL